MSPPEVVSATGEGVADKEKTRDRGLRRPVPATHSRRRVTEPLWRLITPVGDPPFTAVTCRQAADPERGKGLSGGRSLQEGTGARGVSGPLTRSPDAHTPS